MQDLREIKSSRGDFPPVLLFCLVGKHEARPFFEQRWPEAAVVCDPAKEFYGAFGARRGRLIELFGPKVWAAGLRSYRKGHRLGKAQGDPFTMPTMMLATNSAVVWEHHFSHAGDHPDLRNITTLAKTASVR